jgi:hypothetical protein
MKFRGLRESRGLAQRLYRQVYTGVYCVQTGIYQYIPVYTVQTDIYLYIPVYTVYRVVYTSLYTV